MKTLTTKYIATIALFAMTAGFICKADEAQLQLSGKSLTVYPIVLTRPDKPIDEKTQKFGERVSSAGNMWPLALSHQITESLLPVSDLINSAETPEPGPFETQLRNTYEARAKEWMSKMETGGEE